ncbi:ATP-binding cassette domain-containing protein [Modestobacter sp. VKM Ac-2986]|uniref:ATP-binding cassette domain-containing protein n=1 Tax=Modestobacter sp. VKM Ac-2986 TaxID=3004140 RepID=UPI0022AB6DD5|nr:ATP-binding cassette domain-containing protein [Modestobacter sp. VKM Ac-2986]MCZ2829216.1 ATP-binding cassette domain-containing protein [Modestobacter sp. VKM Ac-2986]
MGPAPLVEVRDLTVSVGGRALVSGVGFTLAAGERVALVGASGAGKTLTGLALLGLLPPGAVVTGSVRVGGTELVGASERVLAGLRGRVSALVPQDPGTSLNPQVRVGRQVAAPLRRAGLGRRAAAARVETLLTELRLPAGTARRFPVQLSGGQRQRAALAMALACDPALLLADEPTSALDGTVQAGVLGTLGAATRDRGTALLLVTHDLAAAATTCDRLLVLGAGRLLADGPLPQVLADPQPVVRALVEATVALSPPLPGGAR